MLEVFKVVSIINSAPWISTMQTALFSDNYLPADRVSFWTVFQAKGQGQSGVVFEKLRRKSIPPAEHRVKEYSK